MTKLPVTVPHRACDLTGVVVRYGEVGVTIPAAGEVAAEAVAGAGVGPRGPLTVRASVDGVTGDVTITP